MSIRRILLCAILLVIIIGFGVVASCTLSEVTVEGCELSSAEEIKEKIEEYAPMGNSFLLYLKNRMKPFDSAAFVAKTEIGFEGKNKVIVTVYEKMVAGCVSYMENYVYFDKDGNVLETSMEQKKGVPCISGLKIDNWQMGEKLPIQDERKFKTILNLTQLIEKYSLEVSGIAFTPESEVILQCGTINVELGEGENLSVQLMNLGTILEGLAGKTGTLYMKDFDSNESTASFKAMLPGSGKKEEKKETDQPVDGAITQEPVDVPEETEYWEEEYEESYDWEEESYEEDWDDDSYEEESDDDESEEDWDDDSDEGYEEDSYEESESDYDED